jgi:hypothetical protein
LLTSGELIFPVKSIIYVLSKGANIPFKILLVKDFCTRKK